MNKTPIYAEDLIQILENSVDEFFVHDDIASRWVQTINIREMLSLIHAHIRKQNEHSGTITVA